MDASIIVVSELIPLLNYSSGNKSLKDGKK